MRKCSYRYDSSVTIRRVIKKSFSSINAHNLHLTRIYLLNALRAAQHNRYIQRKIFEWSEHYEEELEDMDAAFLLRGCRSHRAFLTEGGAANLSEEDRAQQQAAVARFLTRAVETLKRQTRKAPAPSPEERATRLVVERFSLSPVAGSFLNLAHYYSHCYLIERLWDHLHNAIGKHLETTAILLDRSRNEVENALRELADLGIVNWEILSRGHTEYRQSLLSDCLYSEFEQVWHPPVQDMAELQERLVARPCEAELGLDDFAHLNGRDDAIRLLRAAVQKRAKGVNILLVGRAGTGKTEFAKTLADAVGVCLYSIGKPDRRRRVEAEDRTEFNRRSSRRNELRVAQALLRSAPEVAILCDEAEDVLDSSRGTRLASHCLLEETPIPVIYTANRLDNWDESMLRRFTLVLRFTAHNPSRQTAILRRMLEESDLQGIDAAACARRLVDELECPPGILAQAIKATRLVSGNEEDLYRFSERLERTIATQCARPRLGPPIRARLGWQSFSHLGQDADDARRTLAAALGSQKKGINILLYGPPGTGKTEFARTLCGAVGARLYAIGDNEIGTEARLSTDRTKTLDHALEALADEPNAAILFDEMEDLRLGEKHWLNRVVEENPVPIIWACNAMDYYRRFEPFFIDRMLHAIEFRHLSTKARARVYSGILHKASIPDAETHQLAEELAHNNKISPRQVAMAAEQVALVSGDGETIRRSVAQKEKLRYGVRPADIRPIEQYDPALVHADMDLEELADRMVALGRRRFALCLCGPPGTGKTAFVRYVADLMGIDVLPKRASDLLNMFVGETEQRIAEAFAEALETRSFLVFDEVDSLLADRQSAAQSWKVSMVNELLSQMERHPLPFACTTNRREALDPAAARRFLFCAEFRFLNRPRIHRAYELFFGGIAPPSVLRLTKLTPADFANVRERAETLDFLDDSERIGRALAEECRSKPGGSRVGF